MIRAAILPYARVPGGACCVVVVHDGPAVLVREEIPIGHLETVNGRITRIVGPPEVAAVVARVVEIVRGVEELLVESPPGDGVEARRGQTIGAELLIHGAALLPGVGGDVAARLRALMEDEGPGVGGVTSSPTRAREPAGFTGPDHLAPTPTQSITSVSTGSVRESGGEPTPAPPLAQAPKAGRRVLAVDPGSKHVAAVVLERLRVEGVGGIHQVVHAPPSYHTRPLRGIALAHDRAGRAPQAPEAHHPEKRARAVLQDHAPRGDGRGP